MKALSTYSANAGAKKQRISFPYHFLHMPQIHCKNSGTLQPTGGGGGGGDMYCTSLLPDGEESIMAETRNLTIYSVCTYATERPRFRVLCASIGTKFTIILYCINTFGWVFYIMLVSYVRSTA